MTKTKLTGLDLYILTDTIIHSLQFGSSWSGVATKEARDGVLNKLQKIMSEIEVEVSVEKKNDEMRIVDNGPFAPGTK